MIDAVSAFASAARTIATASPAATRAPAATGLAEAFDNAVRQAGERLHAAEGISLKALSGEATARETVDAVLAAERTLSVAIAVRDKAVSAWLEISRMAI